MNMNPAPNTETEAARLWDSELRSSPFSTVADVEDEYCDACGNDGDACSCDDGIVVAVEVKAGLANVWLVFQSGERFMGSYSSQAATDAAAAKAASTYGVEIVQVSA